jgi:hypothetical protein
MLEMPDDARGELAGLLRKLHAAGLPSGDLADALQRSAKGFLEALGALRSFSHSAQELRLPRRMHGRS